MTKSKKKSYNRRLFSSFQSFYHLSRFYWIREKLNKLDIEKLKILELGCYDGKILHFLKEYPKKYLGLDANWEQGLDLAKRKWEKKSFISFQLCKNPAQLPRGSKWEIGICMETLEHIPNNIVEGYLYQLSKIIDYLLFITIPIERGFPFLIALFFRKNEILSNYTVKDIIVIFPHIGKSIRKTHLIILSVNKLEGTLRNCCKIYSTSHACVNS